MVSPKEGSIRSRVSAIIRDHPDTTLCDECIREMLGRGNRCAVADASRRLAKGGIVLGFERSLAKCGVCEQRRMVICAVRPRDSGWSAIASKTVGFPWTHRLNA